MIITFPETRETIDAIRSGIGRDITFYERYKTPCTGCSIDPITNTSTNSFCIVCSGEGYTYTYSGTTMVAHITHAQDEIVDWHTGGKLVDGDCRVQIDYTLANLDLVKKSDYVLVDNEEYDVRKTILRGVKALNRILVDLVRK
jgi:hypothetical protein